MNKTEKLKLKERLAYLQLMHDMYQELFRSIPENDRNSQNPLYVKLKAELHKFEKLIKENDLRPIKTEEDLTAKYPLDHESYKFPAELARIVEKTTHGLQKSDFKGVFADAHGFSKASWEKNGLKMFVRVNDIPSLSLRRETNDSESVVPKLGVSQQKNIDALMILLAQVNEKRDKAGKEKKGMASFSLKTYAKVRGKTDAEIARGGKFYDELKKDLISGAVVTYQYEERAEGDKTMDVHVLPSFYVLLEPKRKRQNWKVYFNRPYEDIILSGVQYYPVLLDALQDKSTDGENGYLYRFVKQLLKYRDTGTGFRTQIKISNLLKQINIGASVRSRPRESFKVLCKCISYVVSRDALKELIKAVWFFDSGRCERCEVVKDLGRFKDWDYTDFKAEILGNLGLTNVLDAIIGFNSPESFKPQDETKIVRGQDLQTL